MRSRRWFSRCILTARALERALANVALPRALVPLVLASLITLANPVLILYSPVSRRYVENVAKEMIFDRMKTPRQQFFFVDRPGDNRLNGRPDLVYDDWLYPVFESVKMAEPRSIWLLVRLTSGSVRCVVNTSDTPQIPGLSETLPELGFIRRIQVGPFFVWERDPRCPVALPTLKGSLTSHAVLVPATLSSGRVPAGPPHRLGSSGGAAVNPSRVSSRRVTVPRS